MKLIYIGDIGEFTDGDKILNKPKPEIINAKVIDVEYDYFAECFVLGFDNGKRIHIEYFEFDGISGDINNTYSVPQDIYSKHEYLLNGNSSFKRTIGNSNDSIVYESLYIR